MAYKIEENKIELKGRLSPEIEIGEICLCGDDDCLHREEIPIQFNIIAQVDMEEMGELCKQIQNIKELGWKRDEERNWILTLEEE